MSFGFSATEIIKVVKWCWDLGEKVKQAPAEFAEIASQVELLHDVLTAVQDAAANRESFLHQNRALSVKLTNAVEDVKRTVLPRLEEILGKCRSLGSEKPKILDRFRLPSRRDLLEIRGSILLSTQIISTLLDTLQAGGLRRIEKKLDNQDDTLESLAEQSSLQTDALASLKGETSRQGHTLGHIEQLSRLHIGALGRIEHRVEEALPRLLDFVDMFSAEARLGNTPSSVLSSDDGEVWAGFRERLRRMGVTSESLELHELTILSRIRELREEGLLDSGVSHSEVDATDNEDDTETEVEADAPRCAPQPAGVVSVGYSASYRAPHCETDSEDDSRPLRPLRSSSETGAPLMRAEPEREECGQPRNAAKDCATGGKNAVRGVTWADGYKNDSSDADSEGTITPTTSSTSPRRRRSSSGSFSGDGPPRGRSPVRSQSDDNESRRRQPRGPSPGRDRRGGGQARSKRRGGYRKPTRRRPGWIYRTEERITPKYSEYWRDRESGRLPEAAAGGYLPQVQILLEWGCHLESHGPPAGASDKDKAEHKPQTALSVAVQKGHFVVAKYLLECGAEVRHVPLFWPVKDNRMDIARLMVEYGAFIDMGFTTALHVAADLGYPDIANMLLDHGAEVDAVNEHGQTSLFLAAWQGRDRVVKMLLDEGASVNPQTSSECSALYKAAGRGYEGIVAQLLKRGARPDEGRGSAGETALFKAVINGHVGVVERLIFAEADPSLPNMSQAPVRGRDKKIDWIEFDLHGTRGLSLDPFVMMKKWLDKEHHSRTGRLTPLHGAVMCEDAELGYVLAEMLLRAGADVNPEDGAGQYPLDYAVGASSKQDLVELLKKHGAKESELSRRVRQGRGREGGPMEPMHELGHEIGTFLGNLLKRKGIW